MADVMKVTKVLRQNCCLHCSAPAQNYSGIPEYERIVLVYEDGKELILYAGEKWSDKDFEEKKKLQS